MSIEERINHLEVTTTEVEIRNGGGRHIKMTRKEFDQMVYDKINFKGLFGKSNQLLLFMIALSQFVLLIREFLH